MKHACEREYLVCWDFMFLDDIYTHLRAFLDPVSHLCLAFTSHAHRRHSGAVIRKNDLCDAIASTGSVELMEWALTLRVPIYPTACYQALRAGHLDMLKSMCRDSTDVGQFGRAAAFYGHIHILEWIRLTSSDFYWGHAADAATRGDKITVLDWLLDEQLVPGECEFCVDKENSDDIICWPYEKGPIKMLGIPTAAIEKDSVPLIERLLKAGGVWTQEDTDYARVTGSTALVEWATHVTVDETRL